MIAAIEKDTRRVLLLTDALSLLVAFVLVFCERLLMGTPLTTLQHTAYQFTFEFGLLLGLTVLWCMSLRVGGAYSYPLNWPRECLALFRGGLFCTLLVLTLAPVGWRAMSRNEVLVVFCTAFVLAITFRLSIGPFFLRLTGHPTGTRVLILGDGSLAQRVENTLQSRNGYKLQRCEIGNDSDAATGKMAETVKAALDRHCPHEVIISGGKSQNSVKDLVQACRELGLSWQFVPDLEDLGLPSTQTEVIAGLPVVTMKSSAFSGLNLRVKQLLDVGLASILLLIAAPIMVVVWLLIRLDSEGPAIIVQPRLGYKGKIFNIYKFRTMYHKVDDSAHRAYIQQCIKGQAYGSEKQTGQKVFKIADDKRVTRVGRILRRYSLDELPQIFNVLKLEMSLVGPRPSLAYELESYQDWHKERLEALPGLTGLWQVSGRSNLSFNEMVRLDLEYLRNWTPTQDLRLIIKTIPAIFRGSGV